jgi:curved DNA-binding protein CbpA
MPHVENNHGLVRVLMDYHAMPGSYALNLGQPALAFQHLGVVIAWAQGKISTEQASQNVDLQQLAMFFVQRACLRQENTHYDVLGLDRVFAPDVLRLRYRALISLTHPDKGVSGLPANAAVRINKAYDTLRDADERAHYDSTLSVESPVMSRSDEPLPSSYQLEKVELGSRLQAYIPNFKKLVFFSIPILAVLLVVAMVATSQNPSDLQLVEKDSSSKIFSSKSSSSNHSDSVRTELPQAAVSLAAGLNESERKWFTQNHVNEPLVNTNAAVAADVSSHRSMTENTQRYQFRAKVNERLNPLSADVPIDAGAETSNVPVSTVFSKVADVDTVKVIPAVIESVSRLSLKASSNLSAMSDNKRLNSELNEARFLVTQLISALERPKDAETLQNKMMRQGVSGNLYRLVLPHLQQSSAIRVDQLMLKEKLESNHLVLSGSVALWLGANANQLMPFKYAVNVEFNDIESGPVLSSFDFKEAR